MRSSLLKRFIKLKRVTTKKEGKKYYKFEIHAFFFFGKNIFKYNCVKTFYKWFFVIQHENKDEIKYFCQKKMKKKM